MLYRLLKSLPQPSRPWEEISMDFVTGLSPSKNLNGGEDYDLILVIVDRFLKITWYILCHKTIDALELA
jgi:hypothetical protein